MRAYLIEQLKELIKYEQIKKEHANEILELFDEESDDTSEQTAFEKAQQDMRIALQGEWQ